MGARRLGQDEQYLIVREILSEASTLADGALSRERSDFYRFVYGTLGLHPSTVRCCCSRDDLINFRGNKASGPFADPAARERQASEPTLEAGSIAKYQIPSIESWGFRCQVSGAGCQVSGAR